MPAWLLLAPLALGFLGEVWWVLDLLANFRPQLGLVLVLIAAVWFWFDRAGAAVLLFGAIVGLASVLPFYIGAGATPGADSIEILTFNVGVSNPRRGDVARYIADERPDVVFLFESSFEWEDAMRDAGLPLTLVSVVPRGRVAGVTILASNDIAPRAVDVDVGGEAAAVSVDIGVTRVEVIGVHPPSPTSSGRSERRDAMLAATGEWVADRASPVVVVGDFNATPWSAAYRDLLWRGGLVDTMRGSGLQATWPDGWGPLAIPIDHVLHTRELGSSGRRTGPSFGSAHRPVLVSVGPTG